MGGSDSQIFWADRSGEIPDSPGASQDVSPGTTVELPKMTDEMRRMTAAHFAVAMKSDAYRTAADRVAALEYIVPAEVPMREKAAERCG